MASLNKPTLCKASYCNLPPNVMLYRQDPPPVWQVYLYDYHVSGVDTIRLHGKFDQGGRGPSLISLRLRVLERIIIIINAVVSNAAEFVKEWG